MIDFDAVPMPAICRPSKEIGEVHLSVMVNALLGWFTEKKIIPLFRIRMTSLQPFKSKKEMPFMVVDMYLFFELGNRQLSRNVEKYEGDSES